MIVYPFMPHGFLQLYAPIAGMKESKFAL